MIIESFKTVAQCIDKLKTLGCQCTDMESTLKVKGCFSYNNTCVFYDPQGLLK